MRSLRARINFLCCTGAAIFGSASSATKMLPHRRRHGDTRNALRLPAGKGIPADGRPRPRWARRSPPRTATPARLGCLSAHLPTAAASPAAAAAAHTNRSSGQGSRGPSAPSSRRFSSATNPAPAATGNSADLERGGAPEAIHTVCSYCTPARRPFGPLARGRQNVNIRRPNFYTVEKRAACLYTFPSAMLVAPVAPPLPHLLTHTAHTT
jgi:hypothetical protein